MFRRSRGVARVPAAMSGRIAVTLVAVMALPALAAVLALAAIQAPTVRSELLAAAALAGVLAGGLALLLLYRQDQRRIVVDRELRSANAHVNELVESAMDPIITVDERQRIVTFNAAAEAVFRRSRLAVIGQPLEMLIPERLRAGHRAHIDRFAATGVTSRRMGAHAVLTALRADGAEFPIEASISQHAQDGRMRFTVILRDVSERVRAEERMQRSEARLRGILDSAMDAIITVDEAQKVVLFNAAAEAMFGCRDRPRRSGMPLDAFIPERFRGAHCEPRACVRGVRIRRRAAWARTGGDRPAP